MQITINEVNILIQAFFLLFISEFADKTQLMVISLTSKSKKPNMIFLGAGTALVTITLLEVVIASIFQELIPQNLVILIAIFLFGIIGIYSLADGIISYTKKKKQIQNNFTMNEAKNTKNSNNSSNNTKNSGKTGIAWLITSFLSVFTAELGDKTQLVVFSLAIAATNPIFVFIGASLGLLLVSIIGVLFGKMIIPYVPEHVVSIVSGTIFLLFALVMLQQ